jgi:hypothetical protein
MSATADKGAATKTEEAVRPSVEELLASSDPNDGCMLSDLCQALDQHRMIAAAKSRDFVKLAGIYMEQHGDYSWGDMGADTQEEIETAAREMCERLGLVRLAMGGCMKKKDYYDERISDGYDGYDCD